MFSVPLLASTAGNWNSHCEPAANEPLMIARAYRTNGLSKDAKRSNAFTIGHRAPLSIQPKLKINQPGDKYEQEADRVAEQVMSSSGNPVVINISPIGSTVQRDAASDQQKKEYEEGKDALLKMIEEQPVVKELKAKGEKLGKEIWASPEGKALIITAIAGALSGLVATNSQLPVQLPEIPLSFLYPGLKAKLTWKGKVLEPTNIGLQFSAAGFTLSGSHAGSTGKNGAEDKLGLRWKGPGGWSVGATYTHRGPSPVTSPEDRVDLSLTIPLGEAPERKGPAKRKTPTEREQLEAEAAKWRERFKSPEERRTEEQELMQWVLKASRDPRSPLYLPGLSQPVRTVAPPEEEEIPLARKKATASDLQGHGADQVDQALRGPGSPLDHGTRAFMEQRFGHDFGHVRIHSDAQAQRSARAIDAHAYASGSNIVFGAGRYAPGSHEGRKLLAHELTHVVQQNRSPSVPPLQCQARPRPAAVSAEAHRIIDAAQDSSQPIADRAVAVVRAIIAQFYPADASKISEVRYTAGLGGLAVTAIGHGATTTGRLEVGDTFTLQTTKAHFARRVAQVRHEIEHVEQYRAGMSGASRRDQREFLAHYHAAVSEAPPGAGRMQHSSRVNVIDGALGYYYCLTEDLRESKVAQRDELIALRASSVKRSGRDDLGDVPTNCQRPPD